VALAFHLFGICLLFYNENKLLVFSQVAHGNNIDLMLKYHTLPLGYTTILICDVNQYWGSSITLWNNPR
jgi:hypothetical protein